MNDVGGQLKTMYNRAVVLGSAGAIGSALISRLRSSHPRSAIFAFSRHSPNKIVEGVNYHLVDYSDEVSISKAAALATAHGPLDLVLVATGVLHEGAIQPEKSLRTLSAEQFLHLFEANTIFPALAVKHFLPKLDRHKRAVFAALSARVGSISDNRLGGWYAYRASKAALNMVIKNASIEMARRYKHTLVVGLHPGTVDSRLSQPFQKHVPKEKLFTPDFSAQKLLEVLDNLDSGDSGKCFAWDGKEIAP